MVFQKVKTALGFNKTRIFLVSAAPFSQTTFEYFLSLDIRIFEIYGMSESTGRVKYIYQSNISQHTGQTYFHLSLPKNQFNPGIGFIDFNALAPHMDLKIVCVYRRR